MLGSAHLNEKGGMTDPAACYTNLQWKYMEKNILIPEQWPSHPVRVWIEKDWKISQELGKGTWLYKLCIFSYFLVTLLQSTHHKKGMVSHRMALTNDISQSSDNGQLNSVPDCRHGGYVSAQIH